MANTKIALASLAAQDNKLCKRRLKTNLGLTPIEHGARASGKATMEDPMSKQEATGDPAFLEQQRKRLSAMRDQLLSSGVAKAARQRAPRPEEAQEIEDDAQQMTQSEVNQSIDAVEEQRLRAIERALAKIEEGTYGLSDLSGDPIPKARLEAIPEAVLTIQEEAARERQQRR
jgi:DnaK suppressor protein